MNFNKLMEKYYQDKINQIEDIPFQPLQTQSHTSEENYFFPLSWDSALGFAFLIGIVVYTVFKDPSYIFIPLLTGISLPF